MIDRARLYRLSTALVPVGVAVALASVVASVVSALLSSGLSDPASRAVFWLTLALTAVVVCVLAYPVADRPTENRRLAVVFTVGTALSVPPLAVGWLLVASMEGTGPGGGAIAVPIIFLGLLFGALGGLGLLLTATPTIGYWGRTLTEAERSGDRD